MRVLVLTISDRAAQGTYEDRSGPAVERVLSAELPHIDVERRIVPDDRDRILDAFRSSAADIILTTGGTGLGPRDITPEVTGEFCDRLIPGIAEHLRRESERQTPHSVLSRGTAGARGTTLIVNLPGSPAAAEFCAACLVPVLPHAVHMLQASGH